MTYERFEDLPVWKEAIDFVIRADAFAKHSPLQRDRDYTSQWRRAALSISNNIAEGFERGTTQELLTFIYIARGSAGECRSMTYVFERLTGYENIKFEISNLRSKAESLGKQLRGWANSLQNTNIAGQRRLNDATRREYVWRKKEAEFERYTQSIVDQARSKEQQKSATHTSQI